MRIFSSLTAVAGLIAMSMVAAGAGQGDIYRWKDANGAWHYSDQPQPGAELVRGTRKPPAAPAATAPAPPAPAAGATEPPAPVSAEVAGQVRQEAALAKAENCKKADESYTKAVQARRMYKVDAQGVKTYLNDAELDATRLNARAQRDAACAP
jgi:hypothetical protein